MGNKREDNELNNDELRKGEPPPPPPYEEFPIDEFEVGKSTEFSSVRRNQPVGYSASIATSLSMPPSCLGSNTLSTSQRKDSEDILQSDFFQKPPKFLLYPSKPLNDSETREDIEKGFSERNEIEERPLTEEKQKMGPVPGSTFLTSEQQESLRGEVTLSASQLTPQYNAPTVQQTIITTGSYVPRYSSKMLCPNCNVAVDSQIQYISGQMTHLAALAAFWFTLCLACVPYFINELKDVEHYCPQCRTVLGYNRKKVFEWQ